MRLRCIVLLAVALIASAPAGAGLISQTRTWTSSLASPAALVYNSFNTHLGTLTEVQVTLSGVMVVQATAAALLDGQGNFLPYSFTLESELDAAKLGGTGFAFDGNARWFEPFTVFAPGVVTASSLFDLTFSFDSQSDLLGFAVPDSVSGFTVPPILVNGRRGDFEDDDGIVPTIQQMLFVPRPPQVIGAPAEVTPTNLIFSGFMRFDYLYEERQAVPEPAPLPLFAAALAGLGVALRRRRPQQR